MQWDKLGNPISRDFNPNNKQGGSGQPMLAAEVMLPVVLQDKMGNVIDRQNIPTNISIINTGGLMLSPFST